MSIATWCDDENVLVPALMACLSRAHGTFEQWNRVGMYYMTDAEEYEKAIFAFQQSLILHENNPVAWFGLGSAYTALENASQALPACQKAAEYAPEDGKHWRLLAECQASLGHFEEAKLAYQRALEIHPKDDGLWNALGNVLNDKLEEYEASLACFDRVLDIDAQAYWAMHNKALAYKRLQNYETAIKWHREALKIHPRYASSWDGLGIIYGKLHQFKESEECYMRNINERPYYTDSFYNLGCMFAVKGDKAKALHYLKTALERQRDSFLQYVQEDVDFESLWQDADFLALLARFAKRV